MVKNESVMPIVFSIIDVFSEQGNLIAIWTLFISDAFPYGEKLDGDRLKFSWSEDGFFEFESWVSKKLQLTVYNMEKAGSGKMIKHSG